MAIRKMNKRELARARASEAMPEVKKLVKRFGKAAVGNCLSKIRDHDKQLAKIAHLKREVAQLERSM